ncbi:MAG: sensor histidine kinase [Anaerolineae bacterium]|nr:sensor histidine kinase [Anaerolineae bacterium]
MANTSTRGVSSRMDIRQKVRAELDQAKKSLDEVSMMLEQSQREMEMLMQRNTAITSHLTQVQTQADLIPPADIRAAYTAAMDAQQRILVMRGRMEKLAGDKAHYQRVLDLLNDVDAALSPGTSTGLSATATLLEKVIEAQEAERERLSHQMHDGPAQTLSNFIIQTEIASRTLDVNKDQAKVELDNLKNSATKAFQDIRTFIFELRPMMLDDLGLGPTIKRYTASFEEQTGIKVQLTLRGDEDRRLSKPQEVVLFRAMQELMSNAAFHNADMHARVDIKVNLSIDQDLVEASVADNGKGFTYDETELESKGFGLKLIRERVEMLGGKMVVDTAPAAGCMVSLSIPV